MLSTVKCYFRRFVFFISMLILYVHSAPPVIFVPRQNNTINVDPENRMIRICDTEECSDIGLQISRGIDEKEDPCSDFYEFTCKRWLRRHPIPLNWRRKGWIEKLTQKVTHQIRDILTSPITNTDLKPVKQAKEIYRMCTNNEALNAIGVEPIMRTLKTMGGWPIIMPSTENFEADHSRISFTSIYNHPVHHFISQSLISIWIVPDDRKSTSNIIKIFDPTFYLPHNILTNPDQYKQKLVYYQEYIEEVAQELAARSNIIIAKEQIAKDARNIVKFEIELAIISVAPETQQDIESSYNLMTINDLQSLYDKTNPRKSISRIDWLSLIRYHFSLTTVRINTYEKIVVPALQYIMKLSALLDRVPIRTILNYLQWCFIRDTLKLTDDRMQLITYEYLKKAHSMQGRISRNESCTVSENLSTAISFEYSRRYFRPESKEKIRQLVVDVRDSIIEKIRHASWMDHQTKKKSFEKLNGLKLFLGYPDYYSAELVEKEYEDFKLSEHFFDTALNLKIFTGRKTLLALRNSVNKDQWLMTPTSINGLYLPTYNAIILTAALLQSPSYDAKHPDVLNYAKAGWFAGHEISHSFDINGRKYDKNGNMVQWWSRDTQAAYERKAQCFIDQYDNYVIPEVKRNNATVRVNGRLTASENIADAVGVAAAFQAYRKSASRRNRVEIRLQFLEKYTENQLFFLSLGNMMCTNTRPTVIEEMLSDAHLPAKLRLNGALINTMEFSTAFGCPKGSPMNPEKKCLLW